MPRKARSARSLTTHSLPHLKLQSLNSVEICLKGVSKILLKMRSGNLLQSSIIRGNYKNINVLEQSAGINCGCVYVVFSLCVTEK